MSGGVGTGRSEMETRRQPVARPEMPTTTRAAFFTNQGGKSPPSTSSLPIFHTRSKLVHERECVLERERERDERKGRESKLTKP